jgi:hypothetical protein
MVAIGTAFKKHILPELQAAIVSQQVIGPQAAQQSCICSSVVALPLRQKAHLFQFDHQGASEEARENLPFVSIGSGQPLADPFLAFIRKIFWKESLPNLNMGIFSTLWTLHHAIETNTGGISNPKQMIVLELKGGNWNPRELAEGELAEHFTAIESVEKYLSEFFSKAEQSPEPPQIGSGSSSPAT